MRNLENSQRACEVSQADGRGVRSLLRLLSNCGIPSNVCTMLAYWLCRLEVLIKVLVTVSGQRQHRILERKLWFVTVYHKFVFTDQLTLRRFDIKRLFVLYSFLARGAFVRVNHRAIVMMFICLSIWDGCAL